MDLLQNITLTRTTGAKRESRTTATANNNNNNSPRKAHLSYLVYLRFSDLCRLLKIKMMFKKTIFIEHGLTFWHSLFCFYFRTPNDNTADGDVLFWILCSSPIGQ